MPFYRLDGNVVQLNFGRSKNKSAPAQCRAPADTPEGCCSGVSGFRCDWPVGEGHTCDMSLCSDHAHQVGKNLHYCPKHQAMAKAAEPQGKLFSE